MDAERRDLIFWMVLCGFMLTMVLPYSFNPQYRRTHDLSVALIFFAVLFMKLSNYARDSFWNTEPK